MFREGLDPSFLRGTVFGPRHMLSIVLAAIQFCV